MIFFSTIKKRFAESQRRRKMRTILKYCIEVFEPETIGSTVKLKGKVYVTENIMVDLRKLKIYAVRTPLKGDSGNKKFTRAQRGAIRKNLLAKGLIKEHEDRD